MNNNKYQPDLKENKQKRRFKLNCRTAAAQRGGRISAIPASSRWGADAPLGGGWEREGALSVVYGKAKGFRKEKIGTKREQQEMVKAERLPLTMSSAKLETPEPLED